MPESIVEWKPRPRDRVFIRLSGGRFFTVPVSETNPLETGMMLSDAEIEKLSRIDQYARGHEKALRLLSVRPRSRWEIKKALESMGLEAPVRDGVLDDLRERGLVDDVRFARDFVRSQSELRQMGPHRLRFDLKRRGIAKDIIDDIMDREVTTQGQEAAAWAVVSKKLGGRVPGEKDARRIGDALRRKGIDYAIINQVLYRLLSDSRRPPVEDDE